MDPPQTRVFVRVMDRGSFSQPRPRLGLTPSAVSKLISRLEDRLGVRLLVRSTRRLALTAEGETFLARARRIVAESKRRKPKSMRVRGAPRGTACASIPAPPSACISSRRRWPISSPLSGDQPGAVDHRPPGRSDRGAGRHRRALGPHPGRGLRAAQDRRPATRHLRRARPTSKRRGTPRLAADLKDHDCITVAGAGLNRWPFKTRSGIDVIEVSPRVNTDDAEAALRLAIEGAGIVRLSEVIVGQPLRDGRTGLALADMPSRRAVSARGGLSGRAPAAAARCGVSRILAAAFRPRAVAAQRVRLVKRAA